MQGEQQINSRELGLRVATICGEHFFKLKDLHYGYWTPDLEVSFANLRKAQENYTRFVISHIPADVRSILDVGCGEGQIARELTDRGYKVDCVSPSSFLTRRAQELLGDACHIFECPYEQLQTDNKYDMALFCESFQYIRLDAALEKTVAVVKPGGYLFICDAFKTGAEGIGHVGGGHQLERFRDRIATQPFELIKDIDITEQTAPNLDMLDDAMKNVVAPVCESGQAFLKGRYPLTMKLLLWKFKKRMNKLHEKYLNGTRRAEDFKRGKTYRLLLYRRKP